MCYSEKSTSTLYISRYIKTSQCWGDTYMSKDYPNHFKLYSYNDAIAHSEVVNVGELSEDIWLRLPDGISKYLTLNSLIKIDQESNSTPVDIKDKVERETNRVWIQIDKSVFDLSAGFHLYRLIFDDSSTETEYSLYFCYHIQDNNPEKPYIYMERTVN